MNTEILVLLDRSGSMESIRTDMIGAFDSFIKAQRDVPGECYVTLAQFDSEAYQVVYQRSPLADVPSLTLSPGKMTPLLDAIDRTVEQQGRRFDLMQPDQRPDKVIFVIITDGLENASVRASFADVKWRLTHMQSVWDWSVLYLGANQDAIKVATAIGVDRGSAITYDAGSVGIRNVYEALHTNVARTRAGGQSVTFSAEDRANAIKTEYGDDDIA